MPKTRKTSALTRSIALMFVATPALMAVTQIPVHAQGAAFPDVPSDHWAYQSVQDLADKGLVKGYPNGQFLGKRTLTRYEFATVIDRMLQTLADMQKNQATPPTAAPQVTQDDLNKIQVLVDEFQKELTSIQTDVATAQDNISALRQDLLDTKAIAVKAQDTANNSYGAGSGRKFSISGYIQARYYTADSATQARYPNGVPAANSPYNGNYAQGGASGTFNVRRSRIKFTGKLTANTSYAIQLDASGVANPAVNVTGTNTPTTKSSGNLSSSAFAVSVREGNISYTFGDGSVYYPTLTVGLFANPFGYILPLSSSSTIPAERPLAFNEGGAGLFANQDYDRGAQLVYGPKTIKLTAALINGTGLVSNDADRTVDGVYRAGYQTTDKQFGIGVSYYHGHVPGTGNGFGTAGPPAVAPYSAGKKDLTGVDAQFISKNGPFVLGEYVEGKYEALNAYSSPTAITTTSLKASGNKVAGYYVTGGYTLNPLGNHPLTLAASYDLFQRSKSGRPDSGSSYNDENVGYGLLYNLDKATRVRFWYTKPNKVAHTAASLAPPNIALYTTELQVKF